VLLIVMARHKTHIAVVGAGIGGLALAHALVRCGFRVSLLEQAKTLSEIGAGISIWENGLHALEAIGLRVSVEAVGRSWNGYEIHRPGKPIVPRNNQILSLDGTNSPLIIKRGAMFGVLLNSLSSKVDILTAFKVKDISGHTLNAEDGRTLSADVIIGADGAHSRVRKELTAERPRFCNQICFRGLSRFEGSLPLMAAEVFDHEHHRFGYFPLPKNEIYWFDIVDSKTPIDQFENHRSHVESLSPIISKLVRETAIDSILCHPIEEMRPVTKVKDHIALIGDAAHPMQPSLGQGACLALEDAIVLAHSLKTHSDDIPKGLKTYLSKRKRRWVSYYKMCGQLGTGALDKGVRARKMAIAQMVHTPQWALSIFARRIFAFKQRSVNF